MQIIAAEETHQKRVHAVMAESMIRSLIIEHAADALNLDRTQKSVTIEVFLEKRVGEELLAKITATVDLAAP